MKAVELTTSIPNWQYAFIAGCAGVVLSSALTAHFAPGWVAWIVYGLGVGTLVYVLDSNTPALDRQKLSIHSALTFLKLVCVSAIIVGLTTAHEAFASLFIALPMVAARLVYPNTRRLWLHASALASSGLFLTPIGNSVALCILLLSIIASVWASLTTTDRILAAFTPEAPQRTSRGIALESGLAREVNESAVEMTLETIHRLVATSRAAARARFAGIVWLNDAQEEARLGLAETSVEAPFHEIEFPVSAFFGEFNLLEGKVFVVEREEPAPWYNDVSLGGSRYIASPILDDGIPVGALVVERSIQAEPFSRAELAVAENTAAVIAQALRTERALVNAGRTGQDLKLVARSADRLREALTRNDVFDIASELFDELLGDCSIAIVECEENDVLRVAFAHGEWSAALLHKEIPTDASLVGLSIRRRHALPYRASGELGDPPLFGGVYRPVGEDSRLICPMVSGGKSIGAIVMRLEGSDLFTSAVRERMFLVTNQIAAALANARAYESMVVRATTDGMTRLLNHATFRERYVQAFDRAKRTQRHLSVILLDIDHFKSVNDTYGHGVGDDVIRGVADVIRSQVRKVDLAARYGGEEFCIALEDTTAEGAAQFGERLRAMVEKLQFHGNGVTFRVTISVGVCVFPEHGQDSQLLIENADAALYVSKRTGRNRVSIWSPPKLEELVA